MLGGVGIHSYTRLESCTQLLYRSFLWPTYIYLPNFEVNQYCNAELIKYLAPKQKP